MLETARCDAIFFKRQHHRLDVVRDLFPLLAFEHRLRRFQQLRRECARLAALPRHADHRERKIAVACRLHRDRDSGVRGNRIQIRRDILARRQSLIIARVGIVCRTDFAQQAGELQLFINAPQRQDIRFRGDKRGHVALDRHRGVDGRELLAEQDLVAVVEQALAVHLALHFVRVIERILNRAETHNQIARALVADAGSAGDVVDRIALQRQQIGHLAGLHAHERLRRQRIVPDIVLHRVIHVDVFIDELQHVLIARHDDNIEGRRRAPRQRADHVVRFKPRPLQNRDAQRLNHTPNIGNLFSEVGRHLRPVGLVLGVALLAKRAGRSQTPPRCTAACTPSAASEACCEKCRWLLSRAPSTSAWEVRCFSRVRDRPGK